MTNTEGGQKILGFLSIPFVHPKLIFQLFIDKLFVLVSFVYSLLIPSTRQ